MGRKIGRSRNADAPPHTHLPPLGSCACPVHIPPPRAHPDDQLNGWLLEPLTGANKGTRVVYLNEIDLNGWIPEAILKLVALQVPLAVADVRKYLSRHGPPAFITRAGYRPAAPHTHTRARSKCSREDGGSSCARTRAP